MGGLGQRAGLDLSGDLQRCLDVAERADRRGAARGQQVGRAAAAGVAGEQPGQHRHRARLRTGAVDARARGFEPHQLGADVVVDRLVEERERGLDPLLARVQRGRQPPVRAQPTESEDRAAPAPPRVGHQPLQLADLVPAPAAGAEGAIFLHPDAEPSQLAHRRRPLGES